MINPDLGAIAIDFAMGVAGGFAQGVLAVRDWRSMVKEGERRLLEKAFPPRKDGLSEFRSDYSTSLWNDWSRWLSESLPMVWMGVFLYLAKNRTAQWALIAGLLFAVVVTVAVGGLVASGKVSPPRVRRWFDI